MLSRTTFTAFMIATAAVAGCGGDSSDGVRAVPLSGTTYAHCNNGTSTAYDFRDSSGGTMTTTTFANADCTGQAGTPVESAFTYAVGSNTRALDGLVAAPLDLTFGTTTTYTLFRLSGGAIGTQNLNFGATAVSSAGHDGTSRANRHDGIDTTTTYSLQP